MGTYKGIKGVKVQSLASDPPAALSLGQVWYNTTSSVLKYSIEGAGAWSSGGNCNNKNQETGNLGIQTAALYAGGKTGSPTVTTSVTTGETYNGTTWTETNNLITAVYSQGVLGTTTAGLSFGGRVIPGNVSQNTTFSYDGTCWTSVPGTLNTARAVISGCGVQTAGIFSGGGPPPADKVKTEQWDGTSWSNKNDMNTGRMGPGNAGTTTAALAVGGVPPPDGADFTEIWDGTSWTEVADLTTARAEMATWGISTGAMIAAGQSGPGEPRVALVEQWNGTSWTETTDVTTARKAYPGAGSSGTTGAGVIWGGSDTPVSNVGTTATEEWNEPVLVTKTVTVS